MAKESNPYEKPWLRMAALAGAAVLVAFGATSSFEGLSFQPENGDNALNVLGRLILIALFVERGIEVFVGLWRGAAKNQKKHKIDMCMEERKRVKGNIEEEKRLQDKLNKLTEDLGLYTTITVRIALWSGFLIGLLVSIAGVRALQPLFSHPVGETQAILFHGVDILLTASLISGGSEGIHKIVNVFQRFMEETERKAKGRKSDGDELV